MSPSGLITTSMWRRLALQASIATMGAPAPIQPVRGCQPASLPHVRPGQKPVCRHRSNSVWCFDGMTGVFKSIFVSSGSGGLSNPRGMAFGPDGNLYVSSASTNSILRYSGATGAFMNAFVPAGSGGLSGPWGLKFGPDNISMSAATAQTVILRYNGSTGTPLGAGGSTTDPTFATGSALTNGLNAPRGLAFGPDNKPLCLQPFQLQLFKISPSVL